MRNRQQISAAGKAKRKALNDGPKRDAKQKLPVCAELLDDDGEPFDPNDPPTDYDDPDVCFRIAMNNPRA